MVRSQLHPDKPVESEKPPTQLTNVTSRIPRACSSALVPVGFKVNVTTGEKKNKPFFFTKPNGLLCARMKGKSKEPMRAMTYFFKSDANIRSNWRVKSHLYILKSTYPYLKGLSNEHYVVALHSPTSFFREQRSWGTRY